MSLDLLKERFGGSVSTEKKEVNKEKLNEIFNSNPTGDIKSFKDQHQEELKEKDIIIENLTRELGKQRLENKLALNTKKIYEDKIEKINIVDFNTELISMLTNESRKKQGNQILDWTNWLKISENKYLLQISEDVAKKVFEDNNNSISQYMRFDRVNKLDWPYRPEAGRTSRTRGGDVDTAKNYFLSFTGDTNTSTRKGDLVHTDFNPDDFDLASNGFTISYWVRPDEVGADMFAIGRKAHNNERFTFGMSQKQKGYFGVGSNQSERAWSTMLDEAGMDKATHLVQDTDDKWILVVGRWYHFAVTYAGTNAGTNNMLRKIYMNGQQIWGTGVSDPDNKGNINWSQTGTEMSKGLSFGMRAVRGSGDSASYNNGWACGLDEVAIYDTEHDANFIANVYNGGTNYDHTGASNLVGYWKFNEGGGTRVEDLSGNGNHGLLTNDTYGDDGGAAWVDSSDTPTWGER